MYALLYRKIGIQYSFHINFQKKSEISKQIQKNVGKIAFINLQNLSISYY